ncbi:MAG: 3'-5' exonuclease [Candidatus Faecimonas sp.]|nr:UvrD-helicase domain-containing protein [Mycoplasmatota bacterium]MDY2908553.1 3'-5' exonuclease [Candidatus Faecimonas sp.]
MLEGLNDRQKEAVLYNEGPLLIIAGAGAGKTKTLTTKIAYLIEEGLAYPYNVLAITFTNKAAKEMKDRLYGIIGDLAQKVQVSTFHSFGLKLLRENYAKLGYEANFVIMDSDDSLTVVKKIVKDLGYDPKIYNPRAIRNKISSCKNEMMTPEMYERYAVSDYEKVMHKVYEKYEEKLKKNNSVDFDDLLLLPIKLFKENPSVLQRYQELYQYILIDEYQDTNEAQYILSKLISAKSRKITCVGDDSQSIYSFRGANYKNILNFEKDYKDAKTILLEENYRSTSTILDAANQVIKNNTQRKDKNLWTSRGKGEKIKYYRAYNERDEAQYVIRKVKELRNKDVEYKDIAVLYRTNAQSRVLEEEMLKENMPYRVIGSFYFYSRKEIKDLIAYLRLIHNSKDNVSLLRVINTPKRGIGLKTIENLTIKADEIGTSIYDAISSGKELEFKKTIEQLKSLSEELTLTELIDKVLDASGMRQELESEKTLEAEVRLENLEEFKSITKSFEEREGLVSLEDFLLEISLISDVEEYKDDPNRISLMTVHSVKGLEFNHVFVVGMEEGIFPHMNSLMETSELEEERRLCYVAITRAKDDLHLINARRRTLFGKEQINPVSRFIGEINKDLIETNVKEEELPKQEKKIDTEVMFREEDVDYQVGDYVYHETFGTGKVVEVTNTLVSVAFKHPHGIKKLMKNHKKLSKV